MSLQGKATELRAIVLPSGEGEPLHVFGNPWILKARAEDTGGELGALEGTFRPGTAAPPHIHREHAETFYVLEGEFTFTLGDQSVPATAGTFVFVPRGVTHGFANTGSIPGRVLGIMTPGGFEQLFEELSHLPPGPPDPAQTGAILAKYDQESS